VELSQSEKEAGGAEKGCTGRGGRRFDTLAIRESVSWLTHSDHTVSVNWPERVRAGSSVVKKRIKGLIGLVAWKQMEANGRKLNEKVCPTEQGETKKGETCLLGMRDQKEEGSGREPGDLRAKRERRVPGRQRKI